MEHHNAYVSNFKDTQKRLMPKPVWHVFLCY